MMQLLYIDDDNTTRERISAGLRFAGINCHCCDYVTWLQDQTADKVAYTLVMLGRCDHPLDLDKLLEQRFVNGQPLVSVGDAIEGSALSDTFRQSLIGHLNADAELTSVQQLIHLAQIYTHISRSSESSPQLLAAFADLAGNSSVMNDVRGLMAQVSGRDVSVLISGESGTGKEVVANCLHKVSSRAEGPFVPINCGAIPAELLESELFGHEKGAFTGAVSSRAGRFELANGGTLFLDEIGDMPLNMQVKLLRVIQEKSFERIGGTKTIECDVRIIAATHKDLEQMIADGEFREDLYYRLNVFPIAMPALRDRLEDIPVLSELFIQRADDQGFGRIRLLPEVYESLAQHPWSGNVRELANLIERLTIMQPDSVVGVQELPERFRYAAESEEAAALRKQVHTEFPVNNVVTEASPADSILTEEGIDMKAYLEGIEQELIEQALDTTNNVVARAAEKLQIRRTTLVEKMRKYGFSGNSMADMQSAEAEVGRLQQELKELKQQLAESQGLHEQQQVENTRLSGRMDNLLNLLPAGILVVDSRGKVSEANLAAEELLGKRL